MAIISCLDIFSLGPDNNIVWRNEGKGTKNQKDQGGEYDFITFPDSRN